MGRSGPATRYPVPMASRYTQHDSPAASPPGSDLRQKVELLGIELEKHFNQVITHLPHRIPGPQVLANTLGITTVTASRFLKAISQSDPIATIQLLPGPNPLRRIVEAARGAGVGDVHCQAALDSIDQFDALIRTTAGDRSSFKAMLTAWLPEERKEFEAQRRQSIYKALCELNGVSGECEVNALILHPSETAGAIDILNVKCLLGIDRIRPEAVVFLGTRRLGKDAAEGHAPRFPMTLDGKPALDGLADVRLDEFCNAPPAPLEAEMLEDGTAQYALAPTGFGPASKVDLVIAELNRGELLDRQPDAEHPPYFFHIPEMATRKLVFDLLVHEEVFPGATPSLLAYDTVAYGPARAGDPSRKLSRRDIAEVVQSVGFDHRRLRLLEFPAYPTLRETVLNKLDWKAEQFRAYRVEISYPLTGCQITLAFDTPA